MKQISLKFLVTSLSFGLLCETALAQVPYTPLPEVPNACVRDDCSPSSNTQCCCEGFNLGTWGRCRIAIVTPSDGGDGGGPDGDGVGSDGGDASPDAGPDSGPDGDTGGGDGGDGGDGGGGDGGGGGGGGSR